MPSFALITEGITDQIIIANILYGFFDDPDLDINPLQPLLDETDSNRTISPGNWHKVLQYCSSEIFRGAFQLNDYLIIQIDTDVSVLYGVSERDQAGNELSVDDLIARVKLVLINRIGLDFYEKFKTRIIFAIAVHSIECWLLPLFYDDTRKSKIKNCLESLNRELVKQKSFSIDPNNKHHRYYERASDGYSKHKKLMTFYKSNPSLNTFIRSLEESVPLAQ